MEKAPERVTNIMTVYGISRTKRKAFLAAARRRKYRSTSELIREFVDKVLEEDKTTRQKEAV
jgi:Arc/MetJ-type ribon-helix-helix transcriptional regulator